MFPVLKELIVCWDRHVNGVSAVDKSENQGNNTSCWVTAL